MYWSAKRSRPTTGCEESVNSRPDPTTLPETLRAFAAALRAQPTDDAAARFAQSIVADGLPGDARLRVYRNNARAVFEDALQRTYPVLRRRVGDEFFAQLAREYRVAHPSRCGDLHWIGAHFPAWLAPRLAGTGYEWLVDLAQLEWACEEALVAADAVPVDVAELGRVPAELLDGTLLQLVPALRLVASSYPVWSVWQRNQPAHPGHPVDLSTGGECVVVTCCREGLVLHRVAPAEHAFVSHLATGLSLGEAVKGSGLAIDRLPRALAWLFAERLVAAVIPPGRATDVKAT
jgi:hypothetical protein